MSSKDWYTLEEAAERNATDVNTLCQAAARGEYQLSILGRDWLGHWVPYDDNNQPCPLLRTTEHDEEGEEPVELREWGSNDDQHFVFNNDDINYEASGFYCIKLRGFRISNLWNVYPEDIKELLATPSQRKNIQIKRLQLNSIQTLSTEHVTNEGYCLINDGEQNRNVNLDDLCVSTNNLPLHSYDSNRNAPLDYSLQTGINIVSVLSHALDHNYNESYNAIQDQLISPIENWSVCMANIKILIEQFYEASPIQYGHRNKPNASAVIRLLLHNYAETSPKESSLNKYFKLALTS